MRQLVTSHRWLVPAPAIRLVAGVALALVAMTGCEAADPVAELRAQQAAGDYEGSLDPLRELLAERPDDAELNYLYGRGLLVTQQPSLAEWPLRKAMESPEWLVPAGIQLAYGALGSGNHPTAIEVTGRVLEAEPENAQALLIRANARAYSRLDYEHALADADRVLELEPDNLDAMEPRILSLLGLDRIEEAGAAIELLGKRIEEADTGAKLAPWHCSTAAIFADESGEAELAAERWSACLERFPAELSVVKPAVEFYEARKELDRGQEILRKALDAAPASRDVRVALADRLRARGKPEEAESLLRAAAETEDARLAAVAYTDLVMHYHAVGDYDAGAKAAEQALALARELGDPHPQLLLTYADSLLLAKQYDRALAAADEITVPAYRELVRARVAQEREQPAEALAHFEEVFRLWPDHEFARYYGALAAEQIGAFDRAIESYRYAIRLAPAATDARLRLARLLAAERKPADALEALRGQIQQAPQDLEGELFSLRLWAWTGRNASLRRAFEGIRKQAPGALGRAVVEIAAGVRERSGPEAALRWMRGLEGLELAELRYVEALRSWVRLSHEAGALDAARAEVEAALRANPDAVAVHDVHGLWLELHGAPPGEIRAAYARALELDAADARALAGLARLALANDPAEALALFDRAADGDPDAPAVALAAARALRALGRDQEAEARLEALLAQHPIDAAIAGELANLRLEEGAPSERTLELANRAVRFGGGPEALELSERLQRQQGEPARTTGS